MKKSKTTTTTTKQQQQQQQQTRVALRVIPLGNFMLSKFADYFQKSTFFKKIF